MKLKTFDITNVVCVKHGETIIFNKKKLVTLITASLVND